MTINFEEKYFPFTALSALILRRTDNTPFSIAENKKKNDFVNNNTDKIFNIVALQIRRALRL